MSALPAIRVIRYTPRFARQCARHGRSLPDRVVCDVIVNGSKGLLEAEGSRGGPVIVFRKTLSWGAPEGPQTEVMVLGEVTRRCCVAHLLLSPLPPRKNLGKCGLFESRPSKMNASTTPPNRHVKTHTRQSH